MRLLSHYQSANLTTSRAKSHYLTSFEVERSALHSRQLLKMLRRDTVVEGVAMTSKNVLPHPLLLLRILCAL